MKKWPLYESLVNPAWRRHQELALCSDDVARLDFDP